MPPPEDHVFGRLIFIRVGGGGGSAGKADIIAVTIPSNKMVLNDVKGKYGRPETGDGVGVWEWGCRLN